jgi:hypothetical protein
LIEQVQAMRMDMPVGPEGDAMRKQIQEQAASIRQELAAINSEPVSGDDLRKALGQSEGTLAAWQSEKDRMRFGFESGVQAILTDEQRTRWPALERRLRRDKTLSRGRLSGEAVNILLIVTQLTLSDDARAAIAADLDAYELRLDEVLKAREAYLKRANLELLKAMNTQDRAKAESIAAGLVKSRIAVRDANDDAAKTLAARLPTEQSEKFLAAFQDRGYSRVFRTTGTMRLLNAAAEMPGLDADVIAAVADLKRSYSSELTASNERLLFALRAAEPVEMEGKLVRSTVGGEEDEEPTVERLEEEFDSRLLLGKRVEVQLESLLGPENWVKLPHRPGAIQAGDGD